VPSVEEGGSGCGGESVNIPRFKRAIEIIEATSDNQINLKVWQKSQTFPSNYISSKEDATCGTIACAAGWLAIDPEMQAQGLTCGYGGEPRYNEGTKYISSFEALGHFFGIPEFDAEVLFSPRNIFEDSELTDKQVWLHRAKAFLDEYEGEI
jgi:hypothetical protein